jgi:hypothetical protein
VNNFPKRIFIMPFLFDNKKLNKNTPFMLASAVLIACSMASCDPQYRAGRGPERITPPDNSIPHWVLHPPLSQQYVYGVGTDLKKNRAAAIAEGQRDIARQLHIVIRGDQHQDEIDFDEDSGGPARMVVNQLELPGITITKQFETEYALYLQVALDRQAWAASLRSRISALDNDIQQVLTSHRTNPEINPQMHPIGATARLHQRLQPLVSEREEKAQQLQIAAPGEFISPAPISSATMRENLAAVLTSVQVDIIAAPNLQPILPQLTASCANLGLRITPGAAQPTLRLKLTLQHQQMTVDGMERLEGTFQSTVETGDGKNLGGITITLRSSSLTQTVARDRLNRKILVRWAEYLDNDFIAYLTRL